MKKAVLIVLGLLMDATQGRATGGDRPRNLSEMSLEEILSVPVVTAARSVEKASETQAAATVITAADIRLLGARSLSEVLKLMAGLDVYFEYDQMKTSVGTRGLKGDIFSKRVLFLLDGRPLNQPANGDLDIDFRFPLEAIKQVEVIRGPGSSLYGANAFLGIINIITAAPGDRDLQSGTAGYGSFGNYRASALWGKEFREGAGVVLAASGSGAANYGILEQKYTVPPTVTDIGEGYDAWDVFAKGTWDGLSLQTGIRRSRVDDNDKGRFVIDSAKPTSETRESRLYSRFVDLQYDRTFSGKWSARGHVYYNRYDTDRLYSGATSDLLLDENLLGVQMQVRYVPSEKFAVLLGSDYAGKSTDHNVSTYLQDRSTRELAGFADLRWNPLRQLSIMAGGRYDVHSEFGPQLSPRISAKMNLLDGTASVRLSYGRAFRAPTMTELFLTKSKGFPIEPETLKNTELGLQYRIGDVARITATVFRSTISGPIQFSSAKASYENASAEFTSRGVEIETDAVIAKHLRVFINYTFQDTGNDIPNDRYADHLFGAPRNKLGGGAVVTTDRFDFSLSGNWIGEQRDAYYKPEVGNVVPSYRTLAMRIGVRPIEPLTISLTGKNLFNSSYYDKGHVTTATDPSQPQGRVNWYPGRAWFVDARYAF